MDIDTQLVVEDYGDEGDIAVYGDSTKWKKQLLALGCKYNQNLKRVSDDGKITRTKGYICFRNTNQDDVKDLVENINLGTASVDSDDEQLVVEDYTGGKSVAVYGDSRAWKQKFLDIPCKYNSSLNRTTDDGKIVKTKGFICSKKHEDDVKQLVDDINNGLVKKTPFTFSPRSPAPRSPAPKSPAPKSKKKIETVEDEEEADEGFQKITYMVPLPRIGQTVVSSTDDSEYVVKEIISKQQPIQLIKVVKKKEQKNPDADRFVAYIVNGKWRLKNVLNDNVPLQKHELIFK